MPRIIMVCNSGRKGLTAARSWDEDSEFPASHSAPILVMQNGEPTPGKSCACHSLSYVASDNLGTLNPKCNVTSNLTTKQGSQNPAKKEVEKLRARGGKKNTK